MSITYHKSINKNGGGIGEEIHSGVPSDLFPEVSALDMKNGAKITRKLYIKNNGVTDIVFSKIAIDNTYAVFPSVLFESTGDAQVMSELTGTEVDMSPIVTTIKAGEYKSFWIRVDIAPMSQVTKEYTLTEIKTIY